MSDQKYPANLDHFASIFTEMAELVNTVSLWIDMRRFKVEVYRSITDFTPFVYQTLTYELVDYPIGITHEHVWIRLRNLPDDTATSEQEALAAAFRWLSDRYVKKAV